MEKLEEIETIIKIRLRRGEIDSAKFESWLVMAGLTPEEADKRLDELIKEVEEE